MKNIITTLTCASLLATSGAFADESYNYSTVGAGASLLFPLPCPNFQLGHRERFGDNAIDVNMGMSSIIVSNFIYTNMNYLKYAEDNSYAGIGTNIGLAFTPFEADINFIPNFVIGKEYEKTFSQVKVSLVGLNSDGLSFNPYITYQYGFKF